MRVISHQDLVGVMYTARSILKLDAVHVEVPHGEGSTSEYYGKKPLVAVSHEDLPGEQRSV
jgi:hypothetical protein